MRTSSQPSPERARVPSERAARRWEILRVVLGVMYLLRALAHVALGVLVPEIYRQLANEVLVGIYTDLWRSLVVPYLVVLQPLVAVFEFEVAVALCWRGRVVLIGHAVGAAFQAVLILSGPWGPVNAGLALPHVAALGQSYPTTVLAFVRHRELDA